MRPPYSAVPPTHSAAWVAQTWLSFLIAVGATVFGIYYLPLDTWMRAFLGIGLLFTVVSTFSLAKTVRDMHEHDARTAARLNEGSNP